MGTSYKQAGFGAGIVSGQLLGRTDQQKYAVGLRQCVNAWITRYGTLENRPGTFYDDLIENDGETVRLVRFTSEVEQGLLLVFGDEWVRFFKNGEAIAHPASLGSWSNATPYEIGDIVTYGGDPYLAIADSTDDQPDTSPLSWYLQASDALEWPTPIAQAALATFQTAQINDVMYITGQSFTPQTLSRFADDDWDITDFATSQGIEPPAMVTATAGTPSAEMDAPGNLQTSGGSASTGVSYVVTAYHQGSTQQESPASSIATSSGGPTNGSPVTLTWDTTSGTQGYAIYRSSTEDGVFGIIGVTAAATFIDANKEDNDHGAYAIRTINIESDGGSRVFTYVVTSIDAITGIESFPSDEATCVGSTPSQSNANRITWSAVTGASSYNVYKTENGVFGFIGSSSTVLFRDINIIPDTAHQPPVPLDLFATSDDYPGVVGTYQQRLFFANTINEPQTCWGSAVGVYTSFATTLPVLDSSTIVFTIASDARQYIEALVDLGKFVIHTNTAEYTCSGNSAGTLTPSEITLTNTGSAGCAALRPVVVGNTDVFIQAGATRLLDLRYDVQSFSFNGKDLTKYAPDLFAGRSVVSMDWQKLPHSIIWCVLDNGTLLGLTYVREDDLWAWHQHSTDGAFEQVCVVREGSAHVVYVVVRREIDGSTVRYLENLASREVLDTVMYSDAYFPDSCQLYDGRNTGSVTITATTTGTWTPTDVITLTASTTGTTFTAGDVGDAIVLQSLDAVTGLVDDLVTFTIVGYTSAQVVTTTPQRDVPTWAQDTATTDWGRAVTEFSGIDHLEGADLSILADGDVAADPNDDAFPLVTVESGAFTLDTPAMVVCAGLPVVGTIYGLPVENAQGESIADKRISIREVTPIFYNSRGGLYGQDFDHLKPWVQPKDSADGYPVNPATGPYRIPVQGSPQRTGQFAITLTQPIPWSMSAIVLKLEAGG